MLAKPLRLHTKNDIMAARQGRRSASALLTCFWRKNSLNYSRFGFMVSKKVSNKANKRNLVKRRLRGIIQRQLPEVSGGYDCLIMVRPAAVYKTSGELKQDLNFHFGRAGLLGGTKRS